MLSRRCKSRNESIIPKLLQQHKPTSSPSEMIDLRNADNWFMKAHTVRMANKTTDGEKMVEKDLAYTEEIGGSEAVRASIAKLLKENVSPTTEISTQHMVLGAGASAILDALIEALCDDGDLVMIARPYWSGLDVCVSIHNSASILPVQIPLESHRDPTSIRYYEEALRAAKGPVKAVLICNPHNPLGFCYPRETLEAIFGFCTEHDLHLISDEVYALSVHVGGGMTSALSFCKSDFVHTVYSVSKDFGCNGIRLGVIVSRNAHVRMSVALSTHGQVSSITASFALRHIFNESTVKYALNENQLALRSGYSRVAKFCEEEKIKFIEAEAGLFVFARLCIEDEQRFSEAMLQEGVCLSGGLGYHMNEHGWYRICFSIPPPVLEECLEKIRRTLRKTGSNGVENEFPTRTEAKQSCLKRTRVEEGILHSVGPKRAKFEGVDL